MKQLFWAKQARRQAFYVMAFEETPQHLAVRLKSVRPEVLTHQPARSTQLLLDERQRHLGGGRIREFCQRDRLRALERLIDRNRQPRVLVDQRAADAERVHDREQAGPPVPFGRRGLRVGEEIADIGMAAVEARWRAWTDHGIEFAVRQ